MNVSTRGIYVTAMNAEREYTSYKWSLKDWSILKDSYKTGVESAEFLLTSTSDTTKCVLKFDHVEATYYGNGPLIREDAHSRVQIKFGNTIKFYTLLVTASFMSMKNEKLATFESRSSDPTVKFVDVSFKKSLEETSAAQYLQDDTLILFVEITIINAVQTSLTNVLGERTDFFEHLEEIFDTKHLCDVTFYVGGKKLPAHKLILAASSAVFRAMFTVEMKEKTADAVPIFDANATAFEAFIRYIYTGRVDNLEEIAADLLVIADKYQVLRLKKICEKRMMDALTIDTAIDYLLIANRYSCPDLERRAVDFAKTNIHVLLGQVVTKLVRRPKLISRISNLE